ncbi:hypothetical protein OKW49_003279 [Paraburkholderia youngii]
MTPIRKWKPSSDARKLACCATDRLIVAIRERVLIDRIVRIHGLREATLMQREPVLFDDDH